MDKNITFDIIWFVASIVAMVLTTYNLEPYAWQRDPAAIIATISTAAAVFKFLFDIARKD